MIIVCFLWYIVYWIECQNRKLKPMKPDKKISVTFSIPVELNNMLHTMIDRRKLSSFVAQALEQALREKKDALKEAYLQASKDPDRLQTIKEWETLEGESWDD